MDAVGTRAWSGAVVLEDGRRLAYSEWGDPRGVPVIHQHGMPGSRLDRAAGDLVQRRLGVRLITPDRPGYGLSDPLRGRRLLDWPKDVVQLADALELPTFGITSLSGGGIYALACAVAIPDRLTQVVTSGCPAPLHRAGALRGMRAENVVGLRVGGAAPWLFHAAAAALAGGIRKYPNLFIEEGTHDQPAADRRWMTLPWVRAQESSNLREAFRQGALGYAQDISLLAQPWGFELRDIDPLIQLWHGDADKVIPLHHAKYLVSALPNATLRICEGEGHMLLWNHVAEILQAARGGPALKLIRSEA
jgi:pimeloyl-ACP methyl ester carboxylesterase